jgi:hypothetical protein
MTGAVITIDDATLADSIRSVKQRVFAANRKLSMRRQRLVYRPGPHGMDALADDETLGGAGLAQDGSAELDVLLAELSAAEAEELGIKVLMLLCQQLPYYLLAYCLVHGIHCIGVACVSFLSPTASHTTRSHHLLNTIFARSCFMFAITARGRCAEWLHGRDARTDG